MSITANIRASYVRPRDVMRSILSAGRREDRALATLMGACVLFFVAQWPARAREAHLEGTELARLLSTDVYAMIFVFPLMMYALAAISRIFAGALGGRGSWFGARMALFWALLATTPLLVLNGLVRGFIGPGIAETLVGALWFGAFCCIWGFSMIESETGEALP